MPTASESSVTASGVQPRRAAQRAMYCEYGLTKMGGEEAVVALDRVATARDVLVARRDPLGGRGELRPGAGPHPGESAKAARVDRDAGADQAADEQRERVVAQRRRADGQLGLLLGPQVGGRLVRERRRAPRPRGPRAPRRRRARRAPRPRRAAGRRAAPGRGRGGRARRASARSCPRSSPPTRRAPRRAAAREAARPPRRARAGRRRRPSARPGTPRWARGPCGRARRR